MNTLAVRLRKALIRWSGHKNVESSWVEIEWLLYKMARETVAASVLSSDDENAWQYVIPGLTPAVVKCHQIPYNGNHLLRASVITDDVEMPVLTAGIDHWWRVFAWELRTMDVLEEKGEDCSAVRGELTRRRRASETLQKHVDLVIPQVSIAASSLGWDVELPTISAAYTKAGLPEGKVAWYDAPGNRRKYGIINIDPKAASDAKYVNFIVKHELAHSVMNSFGIEGHGDEFNKLAAKLGIPDKYRD